ncbi:MAG: molybdenum cofactor guanylyltransferase MobA [Gammaproteobacteria bacterium]|nr:molybdenum cofactor guanylyltransferase MobA [Gammaproteobacteria bacterium]
MVPSSDSTAKITGIVLAGGRATRMSGTDKGLISLAGRPMIAHVLEALAPQVEGILISANRNQDRYAAFGYPVVADDDPRFLGPLAGLVSGLRICRTSLVLTVPCDSPLVTPILAERLREALENEGTEVAVAFDGNSLQPVFMLLQRRLLRSLETFLDSGGRKIGDWLGQHRVAKADLTDCSETFINVNDPADHEALEARLLAGAATVSR